TTVGDHQVQLTVTDNSGVPATTTSTVTVTASPPPAAIAPRAATGTSGRGVRSLAVTVPAAVRPGDALVLVLSTDSAARAPETAAGTPAATTPRAPATAAVRRAAGSADCARPCPPRAPGQRCSPSCSRRPDVGRHRPSPRQEPMLGELQRVRLRARKVDDSVS